MANLRTGARLGYVIPRWEWTEDVTAVPNKGIISCLVQENGTPVPHAMVGCYFRPTMQLIALARTDANGECEFRGLDQTTPADPDNGKYFVVALDPAGGTRYNALIFDRVVPT